MKKYTITLSVLTAIIISGCGTTVRPYMSSEQNVRAVKNLIANTQAKVSILPFTSSLPSEKLTCRLIQPIAAPNDMSFASYVEDALKFELESSGVSTRDSSITIKGNLNELSSATAPFNTYIYMDVTLTSSNGKSMNVNSKYEYAYSYSGDKACAMVQQSFVPATQKLIYKILANPEFEGLVK